MESGGDLRLHRPAILESDASGDQRHQLRMFHTAERLFRHQEHLPHHRGGILDQFKALRRIGPQAGRGERGLHRIRRPQMLPVRLRELVEGHQPLPIRHETLRRVGIAVLFAPGHELIAPSFRLPARGRRRDLPEQRRAAACCRCGSLSSTLIIL